MAKQKIVAIIPARGGSKSIPRKNLKQLGNKPLIAWPIELGLSITGIDKVLVSSDDDEIISVARAYGAEVLSKRPAALSKDDVPTFPVLLHTLEELKLKQRFVPDIVVLLYPTTPFLKAERIKQGIKMLSDKQINSIIGVQKVKGVLWQKTSSGETRQFYPKERANRQYSEHLYEEAGNIYLSRAQVLVAQNRLVDTESCRFIEINKGEIMDIDEPEDFVEAEKRLGVSYG